MWERSTAITNIREVAKQSGVSVSTVSRVFNEYADVSPATRERVLAVARKLDYAPSAAARTLVKRQSQLIGVVLFTGYEHPDIHHPFFQEVLVGLKHGIGELGYDLLLFATEQPGSSQGRPHSYLRRARQHGVDGIVVMGVDRDDPEVEKLVRSPVPVIAVDLDVSGDHTSYVASDNIGGARLAVRHLHGLGHTRIATIAGPADTKPGADRILGYRAEMNALGLEIHPGYVAEGDFYAESAERLMQSLLRRRTPPTAVFAAADMMAVGAIRAIQRRRAVGSRRRRDRRLRRHPARRAPVPAPDDDSAGHGRHRARRRPRPRRADREPRLHPARAHPAGRARRAGVLRVTRERIRRWPAELTRR